MRTRHVDHRAPRRRRVGGRGRRRRNLALSARPRTRRRRMNDERLRAGPSTICHFSYAHRTGPVSFLRRRDARTRVIRGTRRGLRLPRILYICQCPCVGIDV